MKSFLAIITILLFIALSCETPEDILKNLDHKVPEISFDTDTLVIAAGANATALVMVKDESGIDRIEFSYGAWQINQVFNLSEEGSPESHSVSIEFTVPLNAETQWEEILYFNDGSSIVILQQYHKLLVKSWDVNRNMNTGILYVKIE
jgi:hypothetical protein